MGRILNLNDKLIRVIADAHHSNWSGIAKERRYVWVSDEAYLAKMLPSFNQTLSPLRILISNLFRHWHLLSSG
jgi:hypothetical protein